VAAALIPDLKPIYVAPEFDPAAPVAVRNGLRNFNDPDHFRFAAFIDSDHTGPGHPRYPHLKKRAGIEDQAFASGKNVKMHGTPRNKSKFTTVQPFYRSTVLPFYRFTVLPFYRPLTSAPATC
jgi:hypothetical protein